MAASVVYYSPLQYLHWYDQADRYEGRSFPELEFWKEMPTTWDDSKVIQGSIGSHMTVARRKSDRWFIGTIVNEARKLEIPLSFLGPGTFTATIYAEDPEMNFRPSPGKITLCHIPGGPGIRWDSHIYTGYDVPPYYDSMIGKLIVHAPDRDAAIERMSRALRELAISGLETSVPFHRRLMSEEDFRAGNISIRYLEEHPDLLAKSLGPDGVRVVVVAAALLEEETRRRDAVGRFTRHRQPDAAAGGMANQTNLVQSDCVDQLDRIQILGPVQTCDRSVGEISTSRFGNPVIDAGHLGIHDCT